MRAMSTPRVALWLFLSLFGVLSACRCGGPPITDSKPCEGVANVAPDRFDACSEESDCGDHYACQEVKDRGGLMCCTRQDRRCNTEADCCPGQTCPSDRKKCFDRFLECDTDADCGDSGDRFCEVWTDLYGTTNRCVFRGCGELGQCPEGQACFQGQCMANLPCEGTCPSGAACVPSSERCQEYACAVSCDPGFLATFVDNTNIWDTCNLPAVDCTCAELPPLQSHDLGRHSAIGTVAEGQIFISHYDGQYGDLVVNRHDADGKLARQDYVDGVPANAPVKYGPSGARGGVVEPGGDVGRYTDLATGGGRVYVSYYDVGAGDLKLAVRAQDGAWRTFKVDGDQADLGRYTSIALDSDGHPLIAYFQKGAQDGFDASSCPGSPPAGEKKYLTALKLARATTANPASAADFQITTLACQSGTAPACADCTDTCADAGAGAACFVASEGCGGACDPNTEVCVDSGGTPTCAEKYNPSALNDLTDGVGLFAKVAAQNKDAVVVYMRRSGGAGRLEGLRVNAAGTATAPVVLDANGDTGWFGDLAIDPANGNLAIAYHDFSSRQLKFLYHQNLTSGLTPEIIDPGVGAPGSGDAGWVGADVSLAFGPTGALFAVYQDATRGDLKLASRTSAWEILKTVRSEGAVGFFADAAFLGDRLFMSHARLRAKTVAGEPRVDNALLLERHPSP